MPEAGIFGFRLLHYGGRKKTVPFHVVLPAAGGMDCTIRIWDLASGQELIQFSAHQGWVAALAFSPDGKMLASGGEDLYVRLWDLLTSRQLTYLPGHHNWVEALAFAPDGKKLASAGWDQTIRIWDPADSRQL